MTSGTGCTGSVAPSASSAESLPPNAIAIIGMAGRFPGAGSVSEFWDNLRDGVESIVTLSDQELAAGGVTDRTLANPAYVRRAAMLSGIDEFDAEFFGFTPQAARMMDPQHRLFLQTAWHALEDAGISDPAGSDGAIGVFGTSSASGYLLHNILSHHDPELIIGQGATFELIALSLQNDKDHLATRASHQFNLRGPSLSVQTACSSSLVAVHLACQSLLSGECEMALAGASSVRVPHQVGYWHEPGSMVSAVGHCRPFDVRADGTVFGSGVAVVVLKPLQAALDDGDQIHAVIRGSAINNDGSVKMTYAAPNAAGQAEVIAEAHAVAEVDASTVGFVETHGTGTPLGDPVEIDGLRQAFGAATQNRAEPCVLGSVKSNIGHLEVASGITGLIKAVLCLKNRAIPGTLHYTSPNPELHLEQSPFVVRSEFSPWDSAGVRRAGVSSFGVGGTNAHIVLEEAPATVAAPLAANTGPQVLLMSARTAEGLKDARGALAAHIAGHHDIDLADAAFTLRSRRAENLRLAAVVNDCEHAAAVLTAAEHDNVATGEPIPLTSASADDDGTESGSGRTVFLFPGQGAQHVGMARGLYESEPVFAEYFDCCAEGFRNQLGFDLRTEVFDGSGSDLARTDLAQPALFAVEYALARVLGAYGVQPAALAGHSIGELVAATIAGVFDLPDALTAVSVRARLMHEAPPGAMLAVALSPEALAEFLTPDVDIATINDPGNCVIAGSDEHLRVVSARLAEKGVVARRVRTAHAFHSSAMDAVLPEFQAALSAMTLHAPRIPLLSNITGTWMTDEQATDPAMWARHIRATVRFADELDAVLTDSSRVLLEVGPGGSLTASTVRHPRFSGQHRAVRLMRHPAQDRGDRDAFLLGLGQLWTAGIDVDWTPLAPGRRPALTTLPGYPFARERHWVERKKSVAPTAGGQAVSDEVLHLPVNGSHGPDGQATPAATGQSDTALTLQRIWATCLGVDTVGLDENFFEIGGDSLIAIGVAMSAGHEGLELSPQDLYENPTVTRLASALSARYAAGGLSGDSVSDTANPPLTPNISRFLATGLSERGRWRVPLTLRLDSRVGPADVTAVLTAVTAHHDALRLRLVDRGGVWEQQIGEPTEFPALETVALPAEAAEGSVREREAINAIVDAHIGAQDLASAPLTAAYIVDSQGDPRFLVLSVHEMVDDSTTHEILVTDLFSAFTQRLAGEEIALAPVGTTWREWSQRCAALATHPAVVERRDYWFANSTKSTLQLAGRELPDPPTAQDMARLSGELTFDHTAEVDDARRRLSVSIDDILLAALARTIALMIGEGVASVDLAGSVRSVLKPDVDLRRTVGWFTALYPISLTCAGPHDMGATQLLDMVHDTLKEVPHNGIGHGLLQFVYAPTAALLGMLAPPDIYFSYLGAIPELPSGDGPVQLDLNTTMPARETTPGLGHALELRVYRFAGVLHVDWWYDTRRVSHTTADALMSQFPISLNDLVQDALGLADGDEDGADEALGLVDLSAAFAADDDEY